MRRNAPLFLACLLLTHAGIPPAAGAEGETAEFRLANGLQVLLRPIQGCRQAAVIVLYSIGEDHDPPGRSGMGHLIEHLYITSAAGNRPARTAEEVLGRPGRPGNAQTGDRFTVFAGVVPIEELEAELEDAAARMSGVRIEASDLERERPRLLQEVANMFGGMPALGAMNHAIERLLPAPGGGRRGGAPDQAASIPLGEMQDRLKKYYKPAGAILSIAGGFDPRAVRMSIEKSFAGIPGGQPPPPPAPGKRTEPAAGPLEEIAVETIQPDAPAEACIAYRAPAPGSRQYAPFLILAARLMAAGPRLQPPPGRFPVAFAPLDKPGAISIGAPLPPGEPASGAIARLDAFTAAAVSAPFTPADARQAIDGLGWILGLVEPRDSQLKENPYGAAFSAGRRKQLGLDAGALKKAIQAATGEEVRRAAQAIFAPSARSAIVVRPRARG